MGQVVTFADLRLSKLIDGIQHAAITQGEMDMPCVFR
jgi:hypothetical protein